MYMLRRVYQAKYRQGKLVASLVRKQQDIYESAGRSKGTVYFNAGRYREIQIRSFSSGLKTHWVRRTCRAAASRGKLCKSAAKSETTLRASASSSGS